MRLTIRTKLLAAFLAAVLMLGVTAYVGLRTLATLSNTYGDLTNRLDDNMIRAREISAAVAEQSRAALTFAVTGDVKNRDASQKALTRLQKAEDTLKKQETSAEGVRLLNAVATADDSFLQVTQGILAGTAVKPDQLPQVVAAVEQPRSSLNDGAESLLTYERNSRTTALAAATAAYTRDRNISLAIAGLAALFCLAVAFVTARAISRPVLAAAHTAQRLADGDLTVEDLVVRSNDEIGDMARAFNQMINQFRTLLQDISNGAQSVMTASEQLAVTAEQTTEATHQTSTAVTQVAAGAAGQAEEAEAANRSMDELRTAIQQIAADAGTSTMAVDQSAGLLSRMASELETVAGNAAGVAEGSRRAAQAAESGAEVVGRTVEGMERIRTAVGDSAAQIAELAQLSVQIGEITQAITGIADQTNLLALNAAIEAARAGEHGRGFAVVADEVRKLAERSAASAGEIDSLIKNIQERTAASAHAMEAGTSEVDRGSQLAAEAGRSLQEILSTVEKAAADVGAIAQATAKVQRDAASVVASFDGLAAVTAKNTAATEEMAASSSRVYQSVEGIVAVARENAAVTEEVSASVTEISVYSGQVSASARDLARVAEELQVQVSHFRLAVDAETDAEPA
ncbi:MAG: methyl-accepting chemotaxis protein [Mycobacterium leprae]